MNRIKSLVINSICLYGFVGAMLDLHQDSRALISLVSLARQTQVEIKQLVDLRIQSEVNLKPLSHNIWLTVSFTHNRHWA